MIVAILGIILGVALGIFFPMVFTGASTIYISVGILAAIDSLFGAFRAQLENRYDTLIFVSGFLGNVILAIILGLIGDVLGLPLYYAAMFVFGTRLFNNLALIRRRIILRYFKKKDK